ncbi:hypothetical protein BGZ94_007931 [Podila epigama]|nr:hypothetical protein BGZ94_007931 [Podila epigama]
MCQSKWLKDRHGSNGLREARFKYQASKVTEDMWPCMDGGDKTYHDVCKKAAAEPNQEDVIVVYVNCVLHSYMHHFAFGDAVSDKVNEREAFVDTTWGFLRTALTIAGIPSRMMEIQIDGNKDRKAEAKQKGVPEAAQLYKATLDKKDDDAWKVKRTMRDASGLTYPMIIKE